MIESPKAFLRKVKDNHLIMSGFYKGLSGLSLFISIPLMIMYLGKENYGLWVLVFTLFQWVLLMDFGIQSSLKTKVPLFWHNKQYDLLKSYIKSTYKISGLIAAGIFIFFAILVYLIDIKVLFSINFHSRAFVNNLFLLNIFFFCVVFVANTHKSLYVAFLKGKYSEESLAVNQFGFMVLLLGSIYFFSDLTVENKLILVSVLNGGFCFLVNAFYTLRFFKMEKLDLKTEKKPTLNFIADILKLGTKYMIIQLGMMFMFSVDNYLISNSFGPKDVVAYDTVNRIFQFPIMIIFAAISPLWSMFTADYLNKDDKGLYRRFKQFNIYFIAILIFIIILAVLCPYIMPIWISSEKLIIPRYMITLIAVVTSLRIYLTFYTFFLNGIGKLNKYIAILLISVALKIPLTFYLIYLDFGINSVVISTLLLLVLWIIFLPYECYSVIRRINK
ncbi:lipopolysaccharide biosynthesis protein [Flavobacterium sp. MK4S-17]|uniref:lipopolysaccharide biosynthesis protein n=1 Tax=Flavobacterium sp. MK4S-17 TaxID=2543737 RepID=UPI001357873C|nr:oligosaccharide flippase family protein [Flavobacterium sp. MK4S-17]